MLLGSAAYAALPPTVVFGPAEVGLNSVTLTWAGVSATPPVQKYQVRYDLNDPSTVEWKDVPGGAQARSHTVTDLDDDEAYIFELRAVNADGVGPSAQLVVDTQILPVDAPSGFTATGGFRKLDLSWTAAASRVAVERYQYRLSTDGGDNWSPGWTDIRFSDHSTTSHTVTGLPDATDYTVELRIRVGSLRSDAARTTARTNNLPSGYKGPPGAPTDLTVTLSHGCHVDLDWSAPLSNGGKAIAKYEQRTRKGNGSFGPWQTDLGNPLATYVTLAATTSCDYSYTYQVRAVNTQAGPRASITFTPLDDGPPNEPVDLIAVGGIQRVALSWKTSATLIQIKYYQVRYRNDRHPDNPWTSWARIPNSNYRTIRHTVTGLGYNNPYILEVRAVNSKGSGASAQQEARTQAEPTHAPAGFTATAGIRKVDLAWTAAASTVAVEAYQYRLSTDGGDTWSPEWTDIPGSNGSTTRHTVSRLANGTAYTVELRIRAGTTHSDAASRSATTPDVPSAPVLSAMPGQRSIALTWTTPQNGGRAITRYQYRRTRNSPGFTLWTNIRGSGPNTTNYTHSSGLSDVGRRYTFEVRAVSAVGNGRAGSVDGRTAVSGDPTQPTIRTWFQMATEGRHAAVDFSVQLHPAASSTVRVDYRTEDRSATAPADYQATAGTLTFAPGETEKTVSVPIVDDTVEDSREKFWLLLSNVSGARLGVERTYGVIYNHEDVLAGFTLVDAAAGTDVGWLADGTEVTLDAPATGQYGVRVETLPEAAIGSLRLRLSGAKAVTRTDNAAPYTLYAEGGEGLPEGAYTLQATAYPDPDGGGTALQTLSVSFTVTAAEASNTAPTGLPEIAGTAEVGGTLTASADDVEDADGLDNATFAWQWLANDGAEDAELAGATGTTYEPGPADVGKTIKVRATFTDDGGAAESIESAATEAVEDLRPTVTGLATAAPVGGWTDGDTVRLSIGFSAPVTVSTDGGTPSVAIALDGTAREAAYAGGSGRSSLTFSYALTADDGTVSAVSVAGDALATNGGTIRDADGRDANLAHAGFDTAAEEPEPATAEPLTASFSDVPATHDGTAFSFGLTFSEAPAVSYRVLRDHAFDVDEGEVETAQRKAPPSNLEWTITVEPKGDGDVTVELSATSDCDAADAICTAGGTPLTGEPAAFTVAGPTPEETEEPAEPLTASFEGVPAAHDGPGAAAFTFRVRFSQEPRVSYTVLRDESFAVTGGAVDKARRVDGRNDLREIHVEPTGWEDVTVRLAGGRACGTRGAICTADDTVLANTTVATVPGPLALRVADARVNENAGEPLAFAVTLNRAATGTVTVAYATADGTATAGADYTATSGTLTFDPGDVTKTVSVPVLDDVHDDGGETFTLTLSNPSGAVIADGTATGTIVNDDPLQRAWLARFGRTVATHVTDAVGERLRGSPGQDSHLTVGGYRLPLGKRAAEAETPAAETDEPATDERGSALLQGVAGLLGLGPGQAGGPGADALTGGGPGWDPWLAPPEADPRLGQSQTVPAFRLREVLVGSSFRLALGGDDAGSSRLRLTAWGRVAGTTFNGQDGNLTLDGDVLTGTVGVDGEWDRLLAGLAVAHSRGDGSFTMPGTEDRGRGDLENTLTSVHPYLRYAVNDRLAVWGLLGYGWGEWDLEMDTGTTYETDMNLLMGAFGGRGILLPAAESGGFELATRTDAMLTRTTSDAVAGMQSAEADAHRLRLILEGSRGFTWAEGRRLTPTMEVGLRHDWGDAETGFGLELGGRVQYADPALGLTVEGAVRALLAHEDRDYQEWGASGTVRLAPGPGGRGLSLTLAPTWGAAQSGVESLWSRQTTAGLAPQENRRAPAGRLTVEVGYGVALFDTGLLTPYAGTVLAEGAARIYRVGGRLHLVGGWATGLDLHLEGTRQDPAGQQPLNQGLRLQAEWSF